MLIMVTRRIGTMVITMLAVSILLFAALQINIDSVARSVLGPYSSDEQRQVWLQDNGYFDPLPVRYIRWLGDFATGDLGKSNYLKRDVAEILPPRLMRTAILGGLVMLAVIPISLALGVLAGMREGSPLDRTISTGSIVTTSIPEFASAPLLTAIFAFQLGWFSGEATMAESLDLTKLVLPVTVLVLYDFGYVARMTRASMAEVMTTHYIRTAVLKGLPYSRVILRHALRNALIAPFTVIMLQINWLLSGVIVVEVFFGYNGFGKLLLDTALNNDLFTLQACAMVAVFVAVSTQTIADIGYTYLNPRIRFN